MAKEIKVRSKDEHLIVEGIAEEDQSADGGQWRINAVGSDAYLLKRGSKQIEGEELKGFAWVGVESFVALLLGLVERCWTGRVSVSTSMGQKYLFFKQGNLVFARSDSVDDRLGEVLYQNGVLTLEELTSLSARVTRELKFGKILISSGYLNHEKLWSALKTQVGQIVRSVFMQDRVSFELFKGIDSIGEILFFEGSQEFINRCYSYGCIYRAFAKRIYSKTGIEVRDHKAKKFNYSQGTFAGDLISLIRDTSSTEQLFKVSKVQTSYTLSALMMLESKGLCEFKSLKPFTVPDSEAGIISLKAKIDLYSFYLEISIEGFVREALAFPFEELNALAFSFNKDPFSPFFLEDNGEVHKESINHIIVQSTALPSLFTMYELCFDSLMLFLAQINSDMLSESGNRQIKYRYMKKADR